MTGEFADSTQRARLILSEAEALVIAAGAGMGVDSGLPDFRGTEGFWNAYPQFRQLGLNFAALANPRWFVDDPRLAWGFYGHRLNLYRRTEPHLGFQILRRWAESRAKGWFVFTSNVDGHFQRAGFDPQHVLECHGSIHRLQRVDKNRGSIWDAGGTVVDIYETTMRAIGPLPTEPITGAPARPNILMFGDWGWNSKITDHQQQDYSDWLKAVAGKRLAVIEMGAGTAIPSVRDQSEMLVKQFEAKLIQINPREPETPYGQCSIASGAVKALEAIGT